MLSIVLYLNKLFLCYPGTRTRAIVLFILGLGEWWFDADLESQKGRHIDLIQRNFRFVYLRFLISEFRLFVSFFWSFFASSLTVHAGVGQVWPPRGIWIIPPRGVPLLNTVILLTSAVSLTASHKCIRRAKKARALKNRRITILLALAFTQLQRYEFNSTLYDISDSIYGTSFFSLTGLHAFHVRVGTFFLRWSWRRIYLNKVFKEDHFFVESSIWYWHFVDVIWIALFGILYIWGGYGLSSQKEWKIFEILFYQEINTDIPYFKTDISAFLNTDDKTSFA